MSPCNFVCTSVFDAGCFLIVASESQSWPRRTKIFTSFCKNCVAWHFRGCTCRKEQLLFQYFGIRNISFSDTAPGDRADREDSNPELVERLHALVSGCSAFHPLRCDQSAASWSRASAAGAPHYTRTTLAFQARILHGQVIVLR